MQSSGHLCKRQSLWSIITDSQTALPPRRQVHAHAHACYIAIYIFVTHCGYRKSQCGEKQVSEGSYELNVFLLFNSFQHIFQAGDPKENGLQQLNSLQQMRVFSFALINALLTNIKLHPSGSNVDLRRRGGCWLFWLTANSRASLAAHWALTLLAKTD